MLLNNVFFQQIARGFLSRPSTIAQDSFGMTSLRIKHKKGAMHKKNKLLGHRALIFPTHVRQCLSDCREESPSIYA